MSVRFSRKVQLDETLSGNGEWRYPPVNGGKYVKENRFAHEIFNFKPFQGAMYGYVQPPAPIKDRWKDAKINLKHFGANANANSVSGVLAVWVATKKGEGARIVGWYENATVFRDWQPPSAGSARTHNGIDCGYFVTAKSEDVVLLPVCERVFPVRQVPERGEVFGVANIWYGPKAPEQHRLFREYVLRYIDLRLELSRHLEMVREANRQGLL